jgi:uncharacterized protein GlcG (DUF336 family)
MIINYPVARILGVIAEAKASELGVPMAMAIVDQDGGLLFFGRMEGTLPASTELAISKAYTAAALRLSTQQVGELAQPGQTLYGIQHTHSGKIVLFGGGLPLRLTNRVAGAVGISGGTVEEDVRVAEPLVRALVEMECWAEHLRTIMPEGTLSLQAKIHLETQFQTALVRMGCECSSREALILTGGILLAIGDGK